MSDTPQQPPREVVFALLNGQRVPIYADDAEGIRRLIVLGAHIPRLEERKP